MGRGWIEMDLFDFSNNNHEESAKPLAERMRANTLEEFIGQKHIVAEGSLLRRAIATDRLGSCIFLGASRLWKNYAGKHYRAWNER